MAINIISPRKRVESVSFNLVFDDGDGSGAMFPCNESGVVDVASMAPAGLNNYNGRIAAGQAGYVERFSNSYVEAAVGKCSCGRKVSLDDPLENLCGCGRAYNMAGQEVIANYGRAECAADGLAYDDY